MADGATSDKRLTAREQPQAALEWDDTAAVDAYANVSNVSFSREEMTINFGLARPERRGGQKGDVTLSHRIMMSPYAAKRLALVLNTAVKQYESRFAPVNLGGGLGARSDSRDQPSATAKDSKSQIVK